VLTFSRRPEIEPSPNVYKLDNVV